MKHDDPKFDPLLTPKQLAKRWQVDPITIRRWRKSGKLSAHHIGRSVRFSPEEIARFEAESKV
jgi:excisionase family DNA binding protein|uniref:helix-turn-helix domain-containing protein n=1 Tax=Prosthecobacter sp. TaxID=1965333 RepID=UPI0037844EDB